MPDQPSADVPQWATELTTKIGELITAVTTMTRRLTLTEHRTQLLAGLFIVDVLLTAGFGYALWAQYRTRVAVLCPLYSVIVSANHPETRKPGPDRDAYVSGYRVIDAAYRELGCPDPPLPPAKVINSN